MLHSCRAYPPRALQLVQNEQLRQAPLLPQILQVAVMACSPSCSHDLSSMPYLAGLAPTAGSRQGRAAQLARRRSQARTCTRTHMPGCRCATRCCCLTHSDLSRDAAFEHLDQLVEALLAQGDSPCEPCVLRRRRCCLCAAKQACTRTRAAAVTCVSHTAAVQGHKGLQSGPKLGAAALDDIFGAEPPRTERIVSPSPRGRQRRRTGPPAPLAALKHMRRQQARLPSQVGLQLSRSAERMQPATLI